MRKLLNKKALSAFLAIVMTFATMAGMFTFSASAATTVTDWTASTVYLNNADDVQYFFNNLILDDDGYENQTFLLTADVDMTGKTITARDGYSHKGFSGVFDGQGHTISNVRVGVSAKNAGLFGTGTATTPVIKNVSFVDAFYYGAWQPGFFYGSIGAEILIENVFVDFKEAKTPNSGAIGGGLIGDYTGTGTKSLTIKNSVVTGYFNLQGGGFVGPNTGTIRLENCAFYGEITKDSSAQFIYTVGDKATLKDCIGLGTINGTNRTFSVSGSVVKEGTLIADTTMSGRANTAIAGGVLTLAKSAMTGTAAQAILTEKGMTGWVATTTGYPMPKTLVKASTPTPADDALTNYVGYQTTKVDGGKFGLRLVGNLDADTVLADYDNVGFKVTAFFGDKAVAQECVVTTVYSEITADFGTSSFSQAGKYVYVKECANLPANLGDITFEVTTFATAADGTTVTLGATYRFVVEVSEIPTVS